MSGGELVVAVLLRDASGALERLLGLLRRGAYPVAGLSTYRSGRTRIEVVVRFAPLRTPRERVLAELAALVDAVRVRAVAPAEERAAREVALARTRAPVDAWPPGLDGVVRRAAPDAVELAGSPREIDGALAFLAGRGVLAASARSGAVLPPAADDDERGDA